MWLAMQLLCQDQITFHHPSPRPAYSYQFYVNNFCVV